MSSLITIHVNGQPREVSPTATIATLLVELGMNPKFLAVECNRVLVPRTKHAAHELHADDRLEIVTLVGGG